MCFLPCRAAAQSTRKLAFATQRPGLSFLLWCTGSSLPWRLQFLTTASALGESTVRPEGTLWVLGARVAREQGKSGLCGERTLPGEALHKQEWESVGKLWARALPCLPESLLGWSPTSPQGGPTQKITQKIPLVLFPSLSYYPRMLPRIASQMHGI